MRSIAFDEHRMPHLFEASRRRNADGSRSAARARCSLVQLVLRAHRYLALLNDGQGRTLSDVAAAEGVDYLKWAASPLRLSLSVHRRQHLCREPVRQPDHTAFPPDRQPACFVAAAKAVCPRQTAPGNHRRDHFQNVWISKPATRRWPQDHVSEARIYGLCPNAGETGRVNLGNCDAFLRLRKKLRIAC